MGYKAAMAGLTSQKYHRVALLERLFPRIKVCANGCWEWIGARDKLGYAVIRVGRSTVFVHQIMWTLGNNRTIPDGLEPHHRCENPPCVRPSHLKMVTHRVNLLLGKSTAAMNARRIKCKRGHPFDDVNSTILYTRRRNGKVTHERICRLCRSLTMKNWRASKPACA